MQLTTERLILKAATSAILTTELDFLRGSGPISAFAQALGAEVVTWPPLYHDASTCAWGLDKIRAHPDQLGWGQWHVLLKRDHEMPLLVASAGFHHAPDANGNSEIGYSVIDPYQRQGIATEAVRAFCTWAFEHPGVNKLTITTFDAPEFVSSSKVAQKCGFDYVGTRQDKEGTLLVYELERAEYEKQRAAKG